MTAARNGFVKIVEKLIELGARVNATTSVCCWNHSFAQFQRDHVIFFVQDGDNALIEAAYENFPAVVKLLIEKGADVNRVDKERLYLKHICTYALVD